MKLKNNELIAFMKYNVFGKTHSKGRDRVEGNGDRRDKRQFFEEVPKMADFLSSHAFSNILSLRGALSR
jgi:hypothetical protein